MVDCLGWPVVCLFRPQLFPVLARRQPRSPIKATVTSARSTRLAHLKDPTQKSLPFLLAPTKAGHWIFDPYINHYYKEPIEAELLVDNDTKAAIRWTIKFVADGTVSSAKLQYDLTYFKARKTARLRAKQPYGDSKEPTFPAVCKHERWE